MTDKRLQDKCRGAFIGGAAGDALGYAVEFSSLDRIRKRYGAAGITAYDVADGGMAEISDDTQMSLFTAEGLLAAIEGGATMVSDIVGEGWVAEETLAISIFSVMRYVDDFEKCMICSVNHSGDSDSTGAVAGNIAGAIAGYEAIPEKFKNELELHDLLVSVADDLAGFIPK